MQTKNIVQASANVIRITNLHQGDIYKRFDNSSNKTIAWCKNFADAVRVRQNYEKTLGYL